MFKSSSYLITLFPPVLLDWFINGRVVCGLLKSASLLAFNGNCITLNEQT
jgi:hypothetical protein